MKTRVTDPRDLRVGDKVGPFVVREIDPEAIGVSVSFVDIGWQNDPVVAELLKLHEVWHDDPEPDVPGERIVARGKVTPCFTINGNDPLTFIEDHTEPGDEIIVVRGETE